jgi:four helix bundle protein
MKGFRKLQVWERAHELTLAVYRATRDFPRDELYGLTSQLRRAATSIPAKIAEGCGRNTDADFARFLDIAMGSASEVEYLLLLAADLQLLDRSEHRTLDAGTTEVKRMLTSLLARLRPES